MSGSPGKAGELSPKQKRALLAQLLEDKIKQANIFPLSFSQERLWFLYQLEGGSATYNEPLCLCLKGRLEVEALSGSIDEIVRRHSILRTSFISREGKPVQVIGPPFHAALPIKDLRHLPEDEQKARVQAVTIEEAWRPFNLEKGPLIRLYLLRLAPEYHIMLLNMHHIITDAWSQKIFFQEISALYNAFSKGLPSPLPELPLQYADFTVWQRDQHKKGELERQFQYWKAQLAGAPQLLKLPMDHPRPPVQTFRGARTDFNLSDHVAQKLKQLNRETGTTLYMILLAAFALLLSRLSGQEDILIGSPIANRSRKEFELLMGFFVNTLVMRIQLLGNPTFKELLEHVRKITLEAYRHQDFPFEKLVEKLQPERSLSYAPIFQVTFQVLGKSTGRKEQTNLSIDLSFLDVHSVKFDLSLKAIERQQEINVECEYSTELFTRPTIERYIRYFKTIVTAVTADSNKRFSQIDILSDEEKKQVLYECNQTARKYPKEKTIHELFERQVERSPDCIALVWKKLQNTNYKLQTNHKLQITNYNISLTYRELNEKSNQLANYLSLEKKIGPGHMVGILMDNSFDLIIAIMGILKAGSAYVPIDLSLPAERIGFIIQDTSIGTVISSKKYIKTLNHLQWENPGFHTYLCMDSRDIYKEEEAERSQLMDEELWHHVGETAEDEIAGGGWVSSYTGEKFSRQEMDEYGDNILKKLEPLLHKKMRALEIGTASGITMFRIAPRVGFYYGTDLSEVIIEKNKKRAAQQGHQNIKLACLAAHEIQQIEEKDFDLIVINSVIHCFHGHQYLRKVIAKLIDRLGPQGYLFIGDIMDQDLKGNLIRDMQEYKRTHMMKNSQTKTDWSTELFVSRGFFADLSVDFPFIASMEFSRKIYTIENELTKFRYDALLYINKEVQPKKTRKQKQKYQEDIRVLDRYPTSRPIATSRPGNTAYIIYTSGTTGKPKGVMIKHQSLVNYTHWASRQYVDKPGEQLTFPLYTNVSFDLTVTSIYLPLITGNRIVIYEQEKDRLPILDVVSENKVDIIKATPSHLKVLQEEIKNKNTRLKRFILGGEELETQLARAVTERFNGNIEIYNEYGPTEATVGCMIYQFDGIKDKGTGVPIGMPIANARIYILDNHLKPVPPGARGEIYISGDALAQGYLNNPELTAEKFCLRRPEGLFSAKGDRCRLQVQVELSKTSSETKPSLIGPPCHGTPWPPPQKLLIKKKTGKNHMQSCNHSAMQSCSHETIQAPPHHSSQHLITPLPHSPIYRTGDLARFLPDGNIEFLGRKDQQVKLRGYRIELKEIENYVLEHVGIKETVVLSRQSKSHQPGEEDTGDIYICCYWVPVQKENPMETAEIKEYLSGKLPAYMVPSYFVKLEKIPLTPNGKVNEKVLPEPGAGKRDKNYIAPGNRLEEKLTEIWSRVLGIEKGIIGIYSNFFQLGGHSLRATVLISKIHKEFEVKIPLVEVFKRQTIKKLAEYIKEAGSDKYSSLSIQPAEKKEFYPLTYHQKRVQVIQQLAPESSAYNIPGSIVMKHPVDEGIIRSVLYKFVEHHASLRTGFTAVNDEPVQFIFHQLPPPLRTVDISFLDEEEKQQKREEISTAVICQPFDLDRPPLFRTVLVKSHQSRYDFIFVMHHIISDGWSIELLKKEFYLLYETYRQGKEMHLNPVQLEYKDFAQWQSKQLETREYKEKSHRFWKEKLAGGVSLLQLTTAIKGSQQDIKGAAYRWMITEKMKDRIDKLARQHSATSFMVMFSAYILFMSRFSHQQDLACFIIASGREDPQLQEITGYFVNPVLFKIKVDKQESFRHLLQRVRSTIPGLFQHQHYPLELVCEDLGTRYPDIRAAFNMLNIQESLQLENIEGYAAYHITRTNDVKFDIEPYITEYKNGFDVFWLYRKEMFQPEVIEYMTGEYNKILDFFCTHPHRDYTTYEPGRKKQLIWK